MAAAAASAGGATAAVEYPMNDFSRRPGPSSSHGKPGTPGASHGKPSTPGASHGKPGTPGIALGRPLSQRHQRTVTDQSALDPSPDESRFKTIKRSLKKGITEFFLGPDDPEVTRQKWLNRCQSLHENNKVVGGKIKDSEDMTGARSMDTLDNSVFTESYGDHVVRPAYPNMGRRTPQPIDPLARHRPGDSRSSRSSHFGYGNPLSRQYSHISTVSSRRSARNIPSRRNRRDSVFKMALDGIRTSKKSSKPPSKKPTISRSFTPDSISGYYEDMESIKLSSQNLAADRYYFQFPNPALEKGLSKQYLDSPAVDSLYSQEDNLDDVFFNTPNPTSPRVDLFAHRTKPPLPAVAGDLELSPIFERSRTSEMREETFAPHLGDQGDQGDGKEPVVLAASGSKIDDASDGTARMYGDKHRPPPISIPVRVQVEPDADTNTKLIHKPVRAGWQNGRMKPQPLPGTPDILGLEDVRQADMVDGIDRIGDVMKEALHDWNNTDRREVGKGFVGKLFDRQYKQGLPEEVQKQIHLMDEHRPYFTYWATFVQVVVYLVAVSVYGIAPWGFAETSISGEVLKPSLAIEKVNYFERDNLWVGPRQADLIHLGAKYSPCMRADDNVVKAIKEDRVRENATACCIRNDRSGCIQISEDKCSNTLSQWYKWTPERTGPEKRLSGSVCGQDPKYCSNPASSGSYKWPDDITRWPVCKDSIKAAQKNDTIHLTCPVVGRPCCLGIQGQCIITTREYCAFRKGYFHEEAALCSQIDCMDEICGMIPFHVPEKPDQFYRLWISLFLHAGLFQLLVTILFQFFVMRDVEKLAGWLRTSIIYIISGVAGSLASAIFLPYHVEAGPAGSQFGIIGCLFTELIQNFSLLRRPWLALLKQIVLLILLFLFGLLPYVDNYAHLFGFFMGFLLAFALLPFITFNRCDRTRKIVGIVACLLSSVALFALLTLLFYVIPIYSCPYCHYFNCIPFTPKFCKSMEVKIGREDVF